MKLPAKMIVLQKAIVVVFFKYIVLNSSELLLVYICVGQVAELESPNKPTEHKSLHGVLSAYIFYMGM